MKIVFGGWDYVVCVLYGFGKEIGDGVGIFVGDYVFKFMCEVGDELFFGFVFFVKVLVMWIG